MLGCFIGLMLDGLMQWCFMHAQKACAQRRTESLPDSDWNNVGHGKVSIFRFVVIMRPIKPEDGTLSLRAGPPAADSERAQSKCRALLLSHSDWA
jgi:hypothetical protein